MYPRDFAIADPDRKALWIAVYAAAHQRFRALQVERNWDDQHLATLAKLEADMAVEDFAALRKSQETKVTR